MRHAEGPGANFLGGLRFAVEHQRLASRFRRIGLRICFGRQHRRGLFLGFGRRGGWIDFREFTLAAIVQCTLLTIAARRWRNRQRIGQRWILRLTRRRGLIGRA